MESVDAVSYEVESLMNYRPAWIIRRGNMVLWVLVVLLLSASWFARYPDMVNGSLKLSAVNAPKLLVARVDGKLQELLVANEQAVQEGQPLAFLQSTGNHRQVLALRDWIADAEEEVNKGALVSKKLPQLNELGDLQPVYQDFQRALREANQVTGSGYYRKKQQALQEDMKVLSSLQENARQRKELLTQDLDLQKVEYNANESLANENVIAPLELNQNKSKLIGKKEVIEQMQAQLINNEMAIQDKKKEIMDLQKYMGDQQQQFRSALFTLKSKVEDWMQQYIVTATEPGKIVFVTFLQQNQLLTRGQPVFYIQPPQSQYYGQLMVSQTGLGKIRLGQQVLIKVESYPSAEFGYLKGIVTYIPVIPTASDSFLIKVNLPDGITTSYHKTIYFRNDLIAHAQVITDNRRLIERFVGRLREVVER
jgi:multidrug resistance efflux pump